MNALFASLGLGSWKALLTPLLLPPAPFILLMLCALAWAPRRRLRAWLVGGMACVGLWFSSTSILGEWLAQQLLGPVVPLAQSDLERLAGNQQQGGGQAVLVLGSGVVTWETEGRRAQPSAHSLARLRHGVWVARQTGLPLAYSGGASYLAPQTQKEAHVAQRVAAEELGLPLRWMDDRSRDTRENAAFSVPMLKAQGVRTVVLVTHGWHMRRALRAFREAAAADGTPMQFVPAPIEVTLAGSPSGLLAWFPSAEGFRRVRDGLREVIGLAAGA